MSIDANDIRRLFAEGISKNAPDDKCLLPLNDVGVEAIGRHSFDGVPWSLGARNEN